MIHAPMLCSAAPLQHYAQEIIDFMYERLHHIYDIEQISDYCFRYVSDTCTSALAVSNNLNTLAEVDGDEKESKKLPVRLTYTVNEIKDGKVGISLEQHKSGGDVRVAIGHEENVTGGLRRGDVIKAVRYTAEGEVIISKITSILDFKNVLHKEGLQPPVYIDFTRKTSFTPLPGRQPGKCSMHRGNLLCKYAAGLLEITRSGNVVSPGGEFKSGRELATCLRQFVSLIKKSQLGTQLTEIQSRMDAPQHKLQLYGSTRVQSITNQYLLIALNGLTIPVLRAQEKLKKTQKEKIPSDEQIQDAAEMEAVLRHLDPICFRPQHAEFTSSELWIILKELQASLRGPFKVVDVQTQQSRTITLSKREGII